MNKQTKTIAVFTGLIIFTVLFAGNVCAITLYDAENMFNNYDKNIANLKKSIDMFNQIIKENRDSNIIYDACWMKSRAYATMGDYPTLTSTDALNDYEAGKISAEKAIKIKSDGEKGYFWYAVNLGKAGQLKGVLNALFMLPEFENYMGKAYKLNPYDPWVLVAYGALYYELPWIVGGSNSQALNYLRRALAVDSHFTVAMVLMAKIYIREGMFDKARPLIEKIINCNMPSSRADWLMSDKPAAQGLLNYINVSFQLKR
ncbi:MAG: tetratricopeptide repeat protein [Deltaproteobacteria bacterium]|nr:tetratricopeptide repeat protein [Deltaproteobacteria bacterium]MCL5792306.1 tetratricopeptide repeat protein [Deltaproteobacteria bacterium]